MAEVEWSNETVVELVAAYRARAELWDRGHELYAVQTAKYEAWTTLARRFRCDIADLRKKMTSVLASYRREKGRIRGGARSSWFLYPHLEFLHGYLPCPPPHHTLPHALKTENKRRTNRLRYQTSHPPARSPSPPCGAARASPEAVQVVVKREPGAHRVRGVGGAGPRAQLLGAGPRAQLLGAVRGLRAELARRARQDECSSFGQYIATALRKHDARAQACIKQAINNILFEQEMNRCSAERPSARAPSPSPPSPLQTNPLAD